LKLRKKYKYIVYRLSDDLTNVVVDKKVESCQNYDDFVAELPENDCRYAVFDFEFEKNPGEGLRNKICFFVWYDVAAETFYLLLYIFRAPDTSKIKQKMLYASSKDAIRKKLVGIGAEIQGTDMSEVAYEAVLEKVKSF
jgi:cofilin